MKTTTATLWREILRQLQTPVALLVLHAILLHIAGQTNAISTIFAAGPQVPRATLLFAVTFLGIRFVVIALIPGFIAARIVYAVLKTRQSRRA
jgi:hypothetical protein